MIHFVVPRPRDFAVVEYLEHWGKPVADRIRVLHYEALPRMERFPRGTWVLAALDQVSDPMLRLVEALHDGLSAAGGVRFLNDPRRTLRRLGLLQELHRRGLNRFTAVRADGDLDSLRYPVFLREERMHHGNLTPLLHSRAELDRAVGACMVRGFRPGEMLVVEFQDTGDDGGLYRKYAAFIVGERVVARSLALGRSWMLKHHGTEWSRPVVEEERDYILENPHAEQVARIARIAGVGYGRIDYALLDGEVQTWEINLNPTIGRGLRPPTGDFPEELRGIRDGAKDVFYRDFAQAFVAADTGSAEDDAVEVELDPELRDEAAAAPAVIDTVARPAGSRRRWARRLLRPLKPLLAPAASAAASLLWRVRRGRGGGG